MTQSSFFSWTTDGTGDGTATGYTQAQIKTALHMLLGAGSANVGVKAAYLNGLAPSNPSSTTIRIATGGALVYGIPYTNDAQTDFTPGDGTYPALPTTAQIHRVVLQASWAAQTVRLAFISGTDAGSPSTPSLTQTDGTTWEIPLYQFQVSSAGAISGTADQREFLDIRTRRFLVPAVEAYNTTATAAVTRVTDQGYLTSNTQVVQAYGNFFVPVDYASAMTVKAILSSDASGTANITNRANHGAVGENWNTHSVLSAAADTAIASGINALQSLSLTDLAAGDYVSLLWSRNGAAAGDTYANNLYVIGWLVEYTASK